MGKDHTLVCPLPLTAINCLAAVHESRQFGRLPYSVRIHRLFYRIRGGEGCVSSVRTQVGGVLKVHMRMGRGSIFPGFLRTY